ncbi:NACHT, LRR and PYD domains-containing protein 12-like isoform X2 [Acipenser ruthenus]|uniref:NACHT, LRR and PYD domains-containing protein 12-like isoform X2 n=1 Tax=Acipenser ruthenus TaxID=7906 RepID=UPI00274159FC|nr:NACHT, LRR and PYD domains-containing protein 12-like isoform X2 [Acipenser ruthenus]
MTTSTKDLILKELEELLQEEYRRFTWKLRDMGLKEGYKHIPKSQLENAERIDVVDKVIDFYGDDYAVEVTAETLVAINKLDLADRLKRDVQKFTETAGKNPQTLSADTPVTRSRLPVALQRLKDDHKSFLKRKFECVSECIAKPGEQSLLNEVFTKVHMTEGEYGELNYKHEVREIEVASKKGRSQVQHINCNDIFIPSEKSPRIRTVLTKGIAGIGKSFSVQKFILDWAAGNDNSGFDFIYIFPFRELNLIKKEISLVELVQLYYPHLKEWEDVSSADSKVLFIFDGLDESRLELDFASCMKLSDKKTATALDVLLINLIKGDLIPSASLWITSRPAATSQIPSEHISRVTEIQGFEDQQKEEYFRKRFKDQTLTEKIISHMRTLRSLHVMCYVPAFCWIIATVLGHTLGENGNENIPRTLTEVYTHFLLVLLTLQNKKHENREELLKQNQEAILNLGKLAFLNLERNKLIFYEHDLRECGIDIRQSSVYSGVCREIFKEDPTFLKDTVYSFVHLTVQEYFAALYVFTSFQNKTALKKLLFALRRHRLCDVYNNALSKASKSRNGHLDLFVRFLLGLGMEKNQKLLKGLLLETEDNLTDVQNTTEYIKQLIKMNTFPERSLNLFHCLSELNDNSLVEEIKVSLTSGNLSRQKLSPSDCSALAYVLLMSEDELDTLDLSRHSLGDEALLRLVPAARLHKRLILEWCDLTGDCCEDLASALCTNQSTLRELELGWNKLGESGMKLTAALKHPNCKLEKLGLEWCDLTGDWCEDLASALCTNQTTLRELQLRGNNLGKSGMKLTAALKHPNCKLEKLGLERCDLTEHCCEDLASALCTNQSTLRELELGWNNLGKSGMKLLSSALNLPSCKIEKLGLERCDLTVDCCEDLASALCTNQSTLRELQLGENNLGESGIKLTAALKHPNCKLEKLGLGQCDLTRDCCEDLASALCTNQSTLRELELRGNKLGESGMKLTAALKHPNCKLEKLGLGRCDLTGDCCEDLASALCTNQSTLRELQLGGNHLGESGMKLLTAALKHPNCKLEKLRLEGCGLPRGCCEDLASALCTNQSTLRELELRENKLGESGMKLTAALKHPNCKLEKLGLVGNLFSEGGKRKLKSLQEELRRSGRDVTVEV